MPLLTVEANKLSQSSLARGVIEEIIDRDAMFALMPFMFVNGKSFDYVRENQLSSAAFYDPNDAIVEDAATFTRVSTQLRILAGQVNVDQFLDSTQSDVQDQASVQIAQKAKAIQKLFRQSVATGDSTANPKQFDGLPNLTDASQVIDADDNGNAAGVTLNLSLMDKLGDQIPGGPDAFIAHSAVIRAHRALVRASGGTTPIDQGLKNLTGRDVPTHNGVPILVNDFLAVDEVSGADTTTSVYAARFNIADGLHGIYGGSTSAGVAFDDLGTSETKDAHGYRLKWYVSLVLRSTKSLARLRGLTNIS